MRHFLLIVFLITVGFSHETLAQKKSNNQKKATEQLVHMVFFKLKPEADKQLLIKSIETFKTINVIKKVNYGEYVDTGNPKTILNDYTVFLQITFDNLEDFRIYEKHPVHLASIEATKNLMAGPPMGYDYFTKK